MSWKDFVEKQNPTLYTPRAPDPRMYPHNQDPSKRQPTHPPTSSSPTASFAGSSRISHSPSTHNTSLPDADSYRKEVDDALDFAEKLLEPEATKRIQPLQALRHRFLHEEDAPDDDELVPHVIGEGRCRDLHAIDADTGQHCVKVRVMYEGRRVWVLREVEAGRGVAIGNRPCEFHVDDIAELEAAS
jgi:cell division control protein 7